MNQSGTPQHMPQLDSLRTFAVAGVAVHHWVPDVAHMFPFFSGVHLFFVLSGFLITGILLDARVKNETRAEPGIGFTLRAFYARRFLRIFPIYYATLLVITLGDVAGLRRTWPWHATYLTNYQILRRGDWIGEVGHFWTLAVEEQFYVFWPWLVLLLPLRWLPVSFGAVALSSVTFRCIGEVAFPEIQMWNLATIGYLDTFAVGALIAYWRRYPTALTTRCSSYRYVLAVCSFAIYYARWWWLPRDVPLVFLDVVWLSLAYGALISLAADGIGGAGGWLLGRPWLQYLGKISYGVYLLHNFARIPARAVLERFPELWAIPRVDVLLMLCWTLGMAMLSWHLFEARINAYRTRFPYHRPR